MASALAGFREFCQQVSIPSKDEGLIPLGNLWGTQRYCLDEIEAGLEQGIHEFVVLKGRQQGVTTICDALDLWWPQRYSGVQGMMVADDDDNLVIRRDIIRQMLAGLPRSFRQGVRADNQNLLAFTANKATAFGGSRLMFAAAGKRTGKTLGRSRGVNYVHGDELGYWVDPKAFGGFQASLSDRFPHRLYLWPSTANGNNLFRDVWRTAERVPSKRAIFIGWWRHDHYRVERAQEGLWEQYGADAPSRDEIERILGVQTRYGVLIDPEQLAWYRYTLDAKMGGDETLMAQEHPWVPEEAFQSFGDKFIPAGVVQRLQRAAEPAPRATGYRYEWAPYLTDVTVHEDDPADATLRIWDEPAPGGVYIVAAHPWGSSSPDARESVVQVWRCWTDAMRLVAEYADGDSTTPFQLAWVFLHMCGAFGRAAGKVYGVYEVSMAGQQFMAELQRFESFGYGLPPSSDREQIANMMGSIRYLYRRLDTFSGGLSIGLKVGGSVETRARVLYQLRDELIREHMEVWSPETIDQLAALRRGEVGDGDTIAGGGDSEESRAMTAAMAVEAMLTQAISELTSYAAPKDPEAATVRVEEMLVKEFLPWVVGVRGRA